MVHLKQISLPVYVLDRNPAFGKLLWHDCHRGKMAQSPRLLIAQLVWTL